MIGKRGLVWLLEPNVVRGQSQCHGNECVVWLPIALTCRICHGA
jgi:hypothetical protein